MWLKTARAEAGYRVFETYTFNGLVGAAGTPASVINKLSQELAVIARSPDIRERIIVDAGEPMGSTPEAFRQFIQTEVAHWRRLAKQAGIKLD